MAKSKTEQNAISAINSLTEWTTISIGNLPSKFNGVYVEISRISAFIIYHHRYQSGTPLGRFNTAEEVVKYLKDNNIPIESLQAECPPCLFNGL